jgi:hypothetical protein
MKARILKVKKEYGGELSVIALVLGVVLGYTYWGSLLIN